MSEAELDALLRDCPVLFHMAERGAWPTIRRHGLLSTVAALDLFGVTGEARAAALRRRPDGIVLERADLGRIVLRDQKPLSDRGLERCLRDGLTPADWHARLNARVFFWLSRARVLTLLAGRAYRDHAHEVLELDAAALVAAHRDRIALSPINSGATGRFPAPRGADTFLPIADYPYAAYARRRRGERAVELTVPGAVPDAACYVRRVSVMRGPETEAVLYEAR
ncbi:hypothetical protein Q8W71_25360 [Methylobacterium sp. NEAU 140]|uniref:DUF7002 family protein n=1 Tax=Methylobacterium sp. NEAU 140 TaxID=3064945 RepID=UPI00273492BB|nr:hypothetical protein [Methylobacterium sp. NEAU 140]MDP4025966.1 hypothetical protein [Methylobacterium sp. NEAU 140]